MHKLTCPRCENPFFTAARESAMPCPECGHLLNSSEERRVAGRTTEQKVCDILKGGVKIPARTVDISDTGLGIKLMGYLPFDQNETVKIAVEGLGGEKNARVVWTKKFYGISRAGLMFC